MDMVGERISLILKLMAMFLSFKRTFTLVSAAVVWAILERIPGFDPSSDTIAPRYLKLWTVSIYLPPIIMSVLIPLASQWGTIHLSRGDTMNLNLPL